MKLFERGSQGARLHHMVRRLSNSSGAFSGGNAGRVMVPEVLWAELGMPARCGDVWWRDPRCFGVRDGADASGQVLT